MLQLTANTNPPAEATETMRPPRRNVGLELECENWLVVEPERLKERIRNLFTLAGTAVEAELSGQGSQSTGQGNGNCHPDNSHANGNGTDHTNGRDQGRKPRMVTANQARAIRAIANRQRFDLTHA